MSVHASRADLIDLDSIPTTHASTQATAFLSQLDRKKRAAATIVPTSDTAVRAALRAISEPITLYGEGPGDRRDRLRELLAEREEVEAEDEDTAMGEAEADADVEEEFYTAGSDGLLDARREIARFSLPRAKARVEAQKLEAKIPLRTHVTFRKSVRAKLAPFELQGSQIAGERPVGIVRFAPDGGAVAAGGCGGSIKILELPTLEATRTLRGHTDRVGGIAWAPLGRGVELASGGGEGNVHLWGREGETPLATLEGHHQRVCRVEFHPSGRYLASASEDTTWRLWDIETRDELLLQEGHSRGVFAVAFNTDGSLLASGGTDSMGRIWDLRTGRTVMILDGHIKPVYALDWGVDGHRVLSGSGDGWVKCWDIRKVACVGGVGAHKSVVSDLRWYKGDGMARSGETGEEPKKGGTFFASAGFDKRINVFSADDWGMVCSLSGHTGNVNSVDVSKDARWIVSGGYDRTVKIWGRNDGEGL